MSRAAPISVLVTFVFSAALVWISSAAPAIAGASADQARVKQFTSLHWERGVLHLDTSQASVIQPPGMVMVRGDDAKKADALVNGGSGSGVEAISADPKTNDMVYFEYTDSGYVKVDDWTSLDPDQMLQNIKDKTEQSNAERESQVSWLFTLSVG